MGSFPVCHPALDAGSSIFIAMKDYFVYIMSNRKNGTLYVGITNNLIKRVYEHKNDISKGFTKKYQLHKLIYFERFNEVHSAIKREKTVKRWRRKWKIELIESANADWKDLYAEIL